MYIDGKLLRKRNGQIWVMQDYTGMVWRAPVEVCKICTHIQHGHTHKWIRIEDHWKSTFVCWGSQWNVKRAEE